MSEMKKHNLKCLETPVTRKILSEVLEIILPLNPIVLLTKLNTDKNVKHHHQ
jgi:hypothetical protein